MKLGLIFALAAGSACLAGLAACTNSSYDPVIVECEGGADTATPKELVCAPDFCGTIVDKSTGATADCGSCSGYSQCGDNGKGNVCGSSCMPYMKDPTQGTHFCDDAGAGCTPYFTNACDLAFGPGWADSWGVGEQFPPSCSYMDPNNCIEITNPYPANGECSGEVCGSFYCCVNNPDAGFNPLLPGAVAGNDGGLP